MQGRMRAVLAALALTATACVALAQQPSIPEEAHKDFVEGNAVFKNAQSKDDYALAESFYQKAVALAPAWADPTCNLSVAQEKLEKYDDAIASSKRCMQLSTPAQARVEQDHEYKLEGLKAANEAQELRARTWTDPVSKLMWTAGDGRQGGLYSSALTYCSNLKLGNFSNWRLPTIYELQALYDPNANVAIRYPDYPDPIIFHIRGNISIKPDVLLGYFWSSSPGGAANEVMVLEFSTGKTNSLPSNRGYTGIMPEHVLCVRNSD